MDKERSWIDPFSDFIDASEEIRNHYRLISGMTFADALLRKWIIDSLLACVQIHLHLLKSPIGGGRDRSIECSEMATERASVGRLISSIKTGQGIGLSDDASSQGRTPWLMEIAVNAGAV